MNISLAYPSIPSMCFLRTRCLRYCASFHKTAHSQMTHEKSVVDQPPKSHCRLCPRNVPNFGMAFTNRSKLCPGNNCWLDYALQENAYSAPTWVSAPCWVLDPEFCAESTRHHLTCRAVSRCILTKGLPINLLLSLCGLGMWYQAGEALSHL